MAEGKKSFTAYCDWIATFETLSDAQAGRLVKHLFAYVNDQNPVAPDALTKAVFAQIKETLKRDLKKWEAKRAQNRRNANKRWHANASERIKKDANDAVSVSVSVRDSVYANAYNSEQDFFEDWNTLRTKHLKKPSNLNRIGPEQRETLTEIQKAYSRQQIQNALIGLFKQKSLPNNNTVMQTTPKHFLNHFEAYLVAYQDKNENLYGKEAV